ncbi:RNA/RNP complex-1-interacting phosphatase [Melanotaenia boesemani]|uniref:RNA/RNP complex-1-interacting phosphatase n=1 Tax=Melanotaenia boesemani TaxID=1250792 RepID=UPI001C04E8D4|nr:RNA/RNP complex-1-interacting phosphatase [Melanotaenia boesemani]
MSKWNKKNDIPDRWQDYTAVGKRLDGTRFIAFKVPLKESLIRKLPRSDVFGPWELLDSLRKQNQELGLIIDLTFTTRYYGLQDIPDSLLCIKILTAGHDVPSDATILSFKRAVHRFLRDNEDNDKLIGVHCTHGLNRTGYLICRYLIDVDGMDPEEAVQLFNSSRGHAIERQNYLEDLQRGPKRSNEGIEESEQKPERGQASRRPSFSSSDVEARKDRRKFYDPRHHRSFPPRGPNHHSHHHLLPNPPLLSSPPLLPFPPTFFHPYRWAAPHLDSQWRRPPPSEDSRSRSYQPPKLDWCPPHHVPDERRTAPPPLPRYSPRWTSMSNSIGAEEDWRNPVRHPQRHRTDENSS